MAKPSMDVTSSVGKLLEEDDVDLAPGRGLDPGQALMETEVSSQIGARPYERSSAGTADRNGYRTRTWDTRVGNHQVEDPQRSPPARTFPSLLEPRRRAEKALR